MSTINSEDSSSPDSNPDMSTTVQRIAKMRTLSDISSIDLKKFKQLNEQTLFTGKSVQLDKFTFEDYMGNEKSAEVIKKRYKFGNNNCEEMENVLSIAILRRHILCDCLILVKHFRPTLKSYVLEFPAKIIEHSENASIDDETGEAAIREVEESTGYKSTIVNFISPEVALDPELSDAKLKLVSLIIDGDDPIGNGLMNGNENDKQADIEVIQVPINGLLDRLNAISKNDIIVDSRVFAFAIGLKKGEKLAQAQSQTENIEHPI
jgi:hypothetical protein